MHTHGALISTLPTDHIHSTLHTHLDRTPSAEAARLFVARHEQFGGCGTMYGVDTLKHAAAVFYQVTHTLHQFVANDVWLTIGL